MNGIKITIAEIKNGFVATFYNGNNSTDTFDYSVYCDSWLRRSRI